MSDATLRTITLQNEEIFQESVKLYLSGHNHDSGMHIPIKHPNVAIYNRMSSNKQERHSQEFAMRQFANVMGFDYDECNIYNDDAVSALKNPSFEDRDEGKRLMQDIANGTIDTVYSFKVDRLFRRMAQGASWMDLMAKKYPKVKVITTDCAMPMDTSQGRMMWHMLLMLSENENTKRQERTQSGMQSKTERLEKTSSAVFGWSEYDSGQRNFTNGKDVGPLIKMEPCWHEQAVIDYVHQAWKMDKGDSFSKIARSLNKWHIPTAMGKEWSPTAISRLIKKPSAYQDQLHQFERPKRLIKAPFRGFKPAVRAINMKLFP